jgi:hypothetical protein
MMISESGRGGEQEAVVPEKSRKIKGIKYGVP